MNRRQLVIILLCVTAAGAAVWIGVCHSKHEKENEWLHTNNVNYADDDAPNANPLIVGKWKNDAIPQWFKVYYDDYDEDGFFWGKEWNEANDVYEDDLNYHGNGWFRWCLKGKQLMEIHKMDVQNVPIPKMWDIRMRSLPRHLILTNPEDDKQCYKFRRM